MLQCLRMINGSKEYNNNNSVRLMWLSQAAQPQEYVHVKRFVLHTTSSDS